MADGLSLSESFLLKNHGFLTEICVFFFFYFEFDRKRLDLFKK